MTRLSLGPLLRLRSDEQLVALFRAGNDDAFAMLVDRYQQRLFAYVRQMLNGSRQDAEDVLQDVYVRAYGALRADERAVNVRAWLYRVAHNRCIDQLRRPTPAPSEIFEMSRKPLHDPIEEAQRREDLRRLVHDVGQLPEQQRSALLMREIDGMSYSDLASALDTSVPAVKSLLVRARVGLAEAAEARDTDCSAIRIDLAEAYDRGVKASGRARRHLKECGGCRDYRVALRGVRRSFAALTPAVGFAPLALAGKLLGAGGAGGAGAAGASAGGGAAMTAGIGAAGACKVAAVVCTAVIATGGAAVEVKKYANERSARQSAATSGAKTPSSPAVAAAAVAAAAAAAPVMPTPGVSVKRDVVAPAGPGLQQRERASRAKRRASAEKAKSAPSATVPGATAPTDANAGTGTSTLPLNATGGATSTAENDPVASTPGSGSGSGSGSGTAPGTNTGTGTTGSGTGTTPGSSTQPQVGTGTGTGSQTTTGGAGSPSGTAGEAPGSGSAPPPEH